MLPIAIMKRIVLPGLMAAAALLAGCMRGTISIADLDGVAFTVEGSTMGVDERDGRVRIYNERAALLVKDGHLFRDTADLGPLRRGDQVRLAANGRVDVNGTERTGRPETRGP